MTGRDRGLEPACRRRARAAAPAAGRSASSRQPPRRTRGKPPDGLREGVTAGAVVGEQVHRCCGRCEQDDVAGPRQSGRCLTTRSMTPVSVPATSITGTSGACRERASAIRARSAPIRTTARSREASSSTKPSTSAPLSRPPATQTTESKDRQGRRGGMRVGRLGVVDEAHARDGREFGDAVPVGAESAQPVPHGARTDAVGPGQSGGGERVGDVVRRDDGASPCRSAIVHSSAAARWRCSTKARSARTSSTTPIIDGAGMPVVKPMARQPSTTSASWTSCSVWRSATL